MPESSVTDILNSLLIEEERSLIARLGESTLFVSGSFAARIAVLREIARTQREHCAALTGLILELGDAPWPRQQDVRTADLHFQDIPHVWPRLLEDIQHLIDVHRVASGSVQGEPRAFALIAEHLQRHERNLEIARQAVKSKPVAA
jgi:hypothetical protein